MTQPKRTVTLAPKHGIGGRRTDKKFGEDDKDSYRQRLYSDPKLAPLLEKYKMGIQDAKKDARAIQPAEDWLQLDLENPYKYRAAYGNPMKENLTAKELREMYPEYKYTKLERKAP